MEKQYLVGMEQLIPWAMSMNVLKTAADAKKERELQRQSKTVNNKKNGKKNSEFAHCDYFTLSICYM